MESLGEKQAKRYLTEFSGVWAYNPLMVFDIGSNMYRLIASITTIRRFTSAQY